MEFLHAPDTRRTLHRHVHLDGIGSDPIRKKQPTDSEHSTGRTVLPDDSKGQLRPQGLTGPTTGSGGAPPENPQGESPPGMQAAPGGSSKTIVDPK